ncbi:MAG: outer membrane beta-barrel protein [Muribaculaceae bacterium]|nr:outer membrane beta-barrel protein [Muribaculaceae bacterium]
MTHNLHKPLRHLLLAVSLAWTAIATHAAAPLPLSLGVSYDRSIKSHQNGYGFQLTADLGSRFRLQPEFIYLTEHAGVATLQLNLNAHWRVPLFDSFGIYPLAGLSYSHWGYDGPNASRWGMNAGCGAEYTFGSRITLFTEVRLLVVSHETQPIYTAGLKYHL